MHFLKMIASCIVPFNRMDAGLVWKELVVLFFMRVVILLVMCCTAMSLPPGVYVRMGNLIVYGGHSRIIDNGSISRKVQLSSALFDMLHVDTYIMHWC